MRRALRGALVVCTAIGLSIAGSDPAFAVACDGTAETAPDGRIREAGNDEYQGRNEFGLEELNLGILDPGQSRTFEVKFRNVPGAGTRKIKVNVDPDVFISQPGMVVRFYANGVKVSKTFLLVEDKSMVFPGIAAGASTPLIEIFVKNRNGSTEEATRVELHGRYGGTAVGGVCDGVRAVVNGSI